MESYLLTSQTSFPSKILSIFFHCSEEDTFLLICVNSPIWNTYLVGATGEAVCEGKQSTYPSLFQFISYIVVMQKLIFSETKKIICTGFIYISILFRIVWGFSESSSNSHLEYVYSVCRVCSVQANLIPLGWKNPGSAISDGHKMLYKPWQFMRVQSNDRSFDRYQTPCQSENNWFKKPC